MLLLDRMGPCRLSDRLTSLFRLRRSKGGKKRRSSNSTTVKADLYRILQVQEAATKAEIKRAFRRLAQLLHPDNNNSNEALAQFQAVNDAYIILGSDESRRLYDETGYASLGPHYAKYAAFGQKRPRRCPENGKDVLHVVWLDDVEAALGVDRKINIQVESSCSRCNSWDANAVFTSRCTLCSGSGRIMRSCNPEQGKLGYLGACPMCGGKGCGMQQWCSHCGGRGLAQENRTLLVRVPSGVHNDSVLRLKGKGDAGRFGGQPGDLYVSFVIKSRPDVTTRGDKLVYKVKISYTDAILGSTYEVPTKRGSANLVIPAGTQHGDILSLNDIPVATLPQSVKIKLDLSEFYEIVVLLPLDVNNQERNILSRLATFQSLTHL